MVTGNTQTIVNAIVAIAVWLIVHYGLARMFKKAGEKGWKAFIPVYNSWTSFKVYWETKYFLIGIGTVVVAFVISLVAQSQNVYELVMILPVLMMKVFGIVLAVRMSRCHGKNFWWSLMIFFFPDLAYICLGFGKSKYERFEGQFFEKKDKFAAPAQEV